MRVSIIIATHNEGESLAKTVTSCIETSGDLDYEVVISDDASSDGSVTELRQQFPMVRVVTHDRRRGISATKALGATHARGDAFVFLDAHVKTEPDALRALVRDLVDTDQQAIVTPTVAHLDVDRWVIDYGQVGHGYAMDLRTFDCWWVDPAEMRHGSGKAARLYESPALMGCAFAIPRVIYERLWGFDSDMPSYGVEDLDLGFKCWLMGYQILHDAQAVIGHRFQTDFSRYDVATDHVLVNQLRMANKNFTDGVWRLWVENFRQDLYGPLEDHPEGLWARVWESFQSRRSSAGQERSYLHSRRVRDEFWYAKHFNLAWPSLEPAMGPSGTVVARPSRGPSPRPSTRPTSAPRPSPSPSIRPPMGYDYFFFGGPGGTTC